MKSSAQKKDHTQVQWTLPSWAAELIFETVQQDSQSMVFEPELREQLAAALETVTETNLSENQNRMKSHTITFGPDGAVRCLWTEAIPLHELGRLDVQRASTVEFNAATQTWEVRLASNPGAVAFSHASRKTCLEWEREALQ
jgi:uncharacterized protein (UPF0218 family)